MRRAILAGLGLALAIFLPLLGQGKGEEEDWQWATKQNEVRAYDQFLKDHPQGAHREEAMKAASRRSVEGISAAAKSCDPLFPRMLLYAVAAGPDSLLDPQVTDKTLSDAANCPFTTTLDPEEEAGAAEGLVLVRTRLVTKLEAGLPLRAVINLDQILLDLEESMVMDAYKKVMKCSDQSAWTDTSPKKARECAAPYMKIQEKAAEGMGIQAKFDFTRVSEVKEREYRAGFWDRFRKMAKRDLWIELAQALKLAQDVDAARKAETDPEIVKKIEDVRLRLAGGKPTGGI